MWRSHHKMGVVVGLCFIFSLCWVLSQVYFSFPAGYLHFWIVISMCLKLILLLQQAVHCRKRLLGLFLVLTRFWLNGRGDF